METMEQIIAEKKRLCVLEKALMSESFIKGHSQLNVQRDSSGKLLSFDVFTYDQHHMESELEKFKEDNSILLFLESLNTSYEWRKTKIRITFLEGVE